MKTPFLKISLLLFSVGTLLFYGILYACGPDWDWDYDGNSSFTPETFVDKSYSPLFFTNYQFFYGIGSDTEHVTRFNEEVLADWSSFLKTNLSPKLVRYFLLESSSKVVKEIRTFYANNKKTPLVIQWEKKIKLNDPKVKSFIQFMYYAQILEKASTDVSYDWNYQNQNRFDDTEWLKNIENKYETATDNFMKNRYWFQTMKGFYYNKNLAKASAFFEKTKASMPKNSLYYRALAYIAGLEYQTKQYAKANYLFSQVFDQCPPLRVVAANCFHPQEQADWEQSLKLAKTNDEKAALWAIQGYYGDEKLALEKIYALSPKSEHLHYLLTRIINIEEQKLAFDFVEKSIPEIKTAIKTAIDKDIQEKINKIAQEEKNSKPHLWHLAAGYLNTLTGHFDLAQKQYGFAEKQMPQTPLAKSQLRVLKFMNKWFALDKMQASDEQSLLADMQWLYVECNKKAAENFRFRSATDISKSYIAKLYRNQNNLLMSEIFFPQSGFYQNNNQLESMKSFLLQPNKTPFELLAQEIYPTKLSDIYDFQAVEMAFQNKIPQAVALMEQSATRNDKLYGNPFIGNIQDCHDCDHAEPQKVKYSRLQYLKTIKDLQTKLANNQNVYENALTLGHAFYNMTYFGNARVFYEGKINGYGLDTYSRSDCSNATTYYKKALAVATDKEQKALCHYMLAKCERNAYYTQKYEKDRTNWYWGGENDNINFLAWNGFKELKNNYSKTEFYQEVVQECGYFKTYISQN